MNVRKLLKVYNYVNDEKRAKVNLKFVAVLAAFLLSGIALAGFFMLQNPTPGTADGAATHTEYVGLSTEEIAAGRLDPALATERWEAWKAEHPDAVVTQREEVRVAAVVVGWRVTYSEE